MVLVAVEAAVLVPEEVLVAAEEEGSGAEAGSMVLVAVVGDHPLALPAVILVAAEEEGSLVAPVVVVQLPAVLLGSTGYPADHRPAAGSTVDFPVGVEVPDCSMGSRPAVAEVDSMGSRPAVVEVDSMGSRSAVAEVDS
jgi:hypothetical protein